MMNEHILEVRDDFSGIRIDRFIAENLPDISRSKVSKLIEEGLVYISEKPVSQPSLKVNTGDKVIISIPEAVPLEVIPVNLPVEILYEDEDLIIVNKPKGMPVHPANGHYYDTLVNSLMFSHGNSFSGINGILRPGIVHRIDMDTTGSLIVCKNDRVHNHIAEQISTHSINRIYEGIVHGVLREGGCINAPIGRSTGDRKKMAVTQKNSKEAVTHYEILEVLRGFTYVRFKLETGRTHQIRVHMAHIGHPLLGDEVYGPKRSPYKLQGQTLHAKTIGFIHPTSGKYMEVEAPLPEYFEELLRKLR